MQKLDISCNNISNDGAVAISKYLKANKTLKELNMSRNKIASHGIIKIAEAIQINTTLRLLDISHNKTSRCRDLVTALECCLKHNHALQVLGISWNDTETTCVYIVNEINNKCYISNTWPNWTKSIENKWYSFKKFNRLIYRMQV